MDSKDSKDNKQNVLIAAISKGVSAELKEDFQFLITELAAVRVQLSLVENRFAAMQNFDEIQPKTQTGPKRAVRTDKKASSSVVGVGKVPTNGLNFLKTVCSENYTSETKFNPRSYWCTPEREVRISEELLDRKIKETKAPEYYKKLADLLWKNVLTKEEKDEVKKQRLAYISELGNKQDTVPLEEGEELL